MKKEKIQYFRPKDKGVLQRASRNGNTHPNLHPSLNDIAEMAQDTIDDVRNYPGKKKQQKQVMDSIRTIIEVMDKKKK